MKRFFVIVLSLAIGVSMKAQTSLVVTLCHETTTTEFYGIDAFANAVTAAVDGDLVTLSAGTFHGTKVNKSLNIRGNGVAPAETATYIDTETILEKSSDEDLSKHWLKIEGVSFLGDVNIQRPSTKTDLNELKDLTMVKCDLTKFSSKEYYPNDVYYGTLRNATFLQCRIKNSFEVMNESEVSLINCIVAGFKFLTGTGGQVNNPKINLLNTVSVVNDCPRNMPYLNCTNSILVVRATKYQNNSGSEKYYEFPTSTHLTNTLVTGFLVDETKANEIFTKITAVSSEWRPMSEVFNTLRNYETFVATDNYALTADAMAFLGTDGSQVGIYGGTAPYSTVVSYPRFKVFNVSEKAVDGVLQVEINVE